MTKEEAAEALAARVEELEARLTSPPLLHGDLAHQAWLKREIETQLAPLKEALAAYREAK